MIFTVTIDGPAAAGKGTVSRAVADHFGFRHLDTGLLYRAVGARMLAGEDAVAAAEGLSPDDLRSPDLRTQDVAAAASRVAIVPEVRAALVAFQRGFARSEGGAVLDGRDIGTVICPEAEAKLYVTASPEIRAERRFAELVARGAEVDACGRSGGRAGARRPGHGPRRGTAPGGRGRDPDRHVGHGRRGCGCRRDRGRGGSALRTGMISGRRLPACPGWGSKAP